uniref:Uncharacterized protein n=2 Tax=Haptolina brevifila TaxID=156173 RepID=A0A7S2N5A8_9EUKA|mmetsp:Transcript_66655/g.132077  ORF Transcript_66655/g.132077 Transcript_66655/m.132077 type:complete len:254 (+) Transcript_66655:192-953(+)
MPPEDAGANEPPGLEVWESDMNVTPAFTQGDVEFLTLVAERMAAQLEYLDLSGKSSTEVVDQQAIAAELQAQADEQLKELVHNRRKLTELSHETFRVRQEREGADPARRPVASGLRFASPRASFTGHSVLNSVLATPAPGGSLPRIPSAAANGAAAMVAPSTELKPPGYMPPRAGSRVRQSASQPALRGGGSGTVSGKVGGGGRCSVSTSADGVPLQAFDRKFERLGYRTAQQELNTPEAVWEDLCRSLRELC